MPILLVMIPFEEIDGRLKIIGRNRKWLAETSGKSPDTIRGALATNAPAFKKSESLQRSLSDTIEREESRQLAEKMGEESPELPPGYYAIYLTGESLKRAQLASCRIDQPDLHAFCIEAIKLKADEILMLNALPDTYGDSESAAK